MTKAGPTQSPIYQFLGATGNLPGWNFSKYVVDKKGNVVAFFPSKVTPDSAGAEGGHRQSVGRVATRSADAAPERAI